MEMQTINDIETIVLYAITITADDCQAWITSSCVY